MKAEQQVLGRLADLDRAIASLTAQVEILQEEFDRQARGVKAQLECTDDHLAGVAEQQHQVNRALGLIQRLPDEQSVTVPRQFEAVQQQVQGLQAMLSRSLDVHMEDLSIGAEVAEQVQSIDQRTGKIGEQVQRLNQKMGEIGERLYGLITETIALHRHNEGAVHEVVEYVRRADRRSQGPGAREELLRMEVGQLKQQFKQQLEQSEQQFKQLTQQHTLIHQWRKESWQMYRVLRPPTWEWRGFLDWITEPVPSLSLMVAMFILIVQLALPGLIRTEVEVAERGISSELVQVNDNVNTALLRLARLEEVIGSNPGDG